MGSLIRLCQQQDGGQRRRVLEVCVRKCECVCVRSSVCISMTNNFTHRRPAVYACIWIIFVFAHNNGLDGVQTCVHVLVCERACVLVCVCRFECDGLAALMRRTRFGLFSNESDQILRKWPAVVFEFVKLVFIFARKNMHLLLQTNENGTDLF